MPATHPGSERARACVQLGNALPGLWLCLSSYVELKNILARQPGPEVAEQLSAYVTRHVSQADARTPRAARRGDVAACTGEPLSLLQQLSCDRAGVDTLRHPRRSLLRPRGLEQTVGCLGVLRHRYEQNLKEKRRQMKKMRNELEM